MTSTSPKPVSNLDSALTADIAAISRIDAVASILEVICRTTGMGFAAVARVTKDRWVACAVRDEIAFGLLPGGELDVKTTICDEIRDSGRAVVIDHVAEDAGAGLILRRQPDEKTRSVAERIRSSVKRMASLIDDTLDFAKARLGAGFQLERDASAPLSEYLDQVVRELRDVYQNPIETRIALMLPVDCDPRRIAQVASNLVANAAKHGAPNGPIRVSASTDEKGFAPTVANEGDPIDEIVARQLFQPFFRGNAHSSNQGLGLGLYIASEIARAHGGKITVASSKEETRFTLHIPPA